MKFKTTRKAVVEGSSNIVNVGCCDLNWLLINHSPVAYTCGTFGWNFDVYEIDGLTICTGYRNMPGRCANNVREYEKKAYQIMCGEHDTPYKKKQEQVEQLLKEFIKQA